MSTVLRLCAPALLAATLAACGSAPTRADLPPPAREPATAEASEVDEAPKRSPYPPAQEDPSKRGDYVAGGLYAPHIQDSAPDELPDVDAIPEPEVKAEPRSRAGNRTYTVLGKTYRVRDSAEGYVEEGVASFYGRKFHGRRTSNQEVYDMYAMTAAHKALPLPSYVRVTNLANGKSVVVRVNDRGPFHAGRIIDLSYAAAAKLGFIKQGTARVEVRALTPDGREGREVAVRTPAPAPAPPVQDNSVSADEFERWMRERGIRFAAGTSAAGTSAAATPAIETPTTSEPLLAPATAGEDVLLQLAAFSARDNAERARERLAAGGVEALRIDEAKVNGQPVWRLRIGPVPSARAEELSARVADLGFAGAQIVRE